MKRNPTVNQTITLNSGNSISAYVYYETQNDSIHMSSGTFEGRSFVITFDESDILQQEDVRLATGEEINWWACVCDEIPRDKFVICQDGAYIWKEIREWDGEDFDVVDLGFEKMNNLVFKG